MVLRWHFSLTLRVQLYVDLREFDPHSTKAMLAWEHQNSDGWSAYYALKLDPVSPGGWSYLCARLPGKLPTEPPGPAIL